MYAIKYIGKSPEVELLYLHFVIFTAIAKVSYYFTLPPWEFLYVQQISQQHVLSNVYTLSI